MDFSSQKNEPADLAEGLLQAGHGARLFEPDVGAEALDEHAGQTSLYQLRGQTLFQRHSFSQRHVTAPRTGSAALGRPCRLPKSEQPDKKSEEARVPVQLNSAGD